MVSGEYIKATLPDGTFELFHAIFCCVCPSRGANSKKIMIIDLGVHSSSFPRPGMLHPRAAPLNNENNLQRLEQISLDKLRPEFRSGLDALTKFVFERTRPKQVGATIMTGPILAGITQSFLDALNNGAVPTISSSWQVQGNVEMGYSSSFGFGQVRVIVEVALVKMYHSVDGPVSELISA